MLTLELGINSSLSKAGTAPPYVLNGFTPPLVLDFRGDVYTVGGTSTTLAAATTFTGSGIKTMTDSDGLLKWGPHNLIKYSEQFDNVYWTKGNSTISANAAAAPDGTMTADLLIENSTVASRHTARTSPTTSIKKARFSVFGKASTRNYIALGNGMSGAGAIFNLSDGTVFATNLNPVATISAIGDGWYLCSIYDSDFSDPANGAARLALHDGSTPSWLYGSPDYNGDGVSGAYVWGAHVRTWGGIDASNNPVRGDSYVPTTTAEKYLPRVGNHIYTDATWVNDGIQLENDARVNLVTYSELWTQWVLSTISLSTGALANGAAGGAFTTANAENFAVYDVTNAAWITSGTPYSVASSTLVERQVYTFTTPSGCTSVRIYPARVLAGDFVALNNIAVSATASYTMSFFHQKVGATQIVGGVQLEAGATPSSYIQTLGTAKTRLADAIPTDAASMPVITNSISGTSDRLITYADTGTATEQTLFDWRVDANNRITVTLDTAGALTGKFTLTCVKAGVSTSLSTINQITAGQNVAAKVAWRVTTTEINIALNGTAATAITNVAGMPALAAADVASNGMSSNALERIFNDDVGDAGLMEATT